MPNCSILFSKFLIAGISLKSGRGIFAKFEAKASDLLSESLSWELSPNDISYLDITSIEGFWFHHPEKIGWGLFPIGAAALVNCSLHPNAQIDWRLHELGFIGYMTAIVPIKAGEEILVDYGIGIPEGWNN